MVSYMLKTIRPQRLHCLIAVLLLILFTTACGRSTPQETTSELLTSAPAEVQALYKQNCISCHGADLEGRTGPNSNLTQVGSRLSEADIVNKIMHGGGGMIAFENKLSESEIASLAKWLSSLQ